MTTLVTGAAGFLGGRVIDELVARDQRPRALVQTVGDSARLPDGVVDRVVGDVRDEAVLAAAVRDVEWVVHCAARTGPWGPAREYQTTNVEALETLVRVAMKAGVRQIVFVSSITVHGNDVGGSANEMSSFHVETNPYSRSKVAAELLLQRLVADDGAAVTIVRPGYIYGPRDVAGFGRFAAKIRDGRMVVIGSGDNHLPLVHVRDVVQGVLQAGARGAPGRAYVLVNDEPVTQRQYLDAIAAHLGVPPPTRHVPYRLAVTLGKAFEYSARLIKAERPPPVTRYGVRLLGGENRFTIDRARHELGFAPRVDLRAGVRESVEWFEHQSRSRARQGAPR